MAFDVIHKAAMVKVAELGRKGFSNLPGTERLPEAAPGTSYVPETQQRLQNFGNYLKTKAMDWGGDRLRGAAHFVLPGDAYDTAKDIWYKSFNNTESPVDKVMGYADKKIRPIAKSTLKTVLPEKAYNYVAAAGRGGIKPTKRIDNIVDALNADKYVNPDTVEELPFAPGTLSHQLYLEDKERDKNSRWKVKPDTREAKTISLPEGTRLYQMALQEAGSPKYGYLRYNGYSEEQIAQMILEKYYKPALVEATGTNDINEYTNVSDDQWNRWKELLANKALAAQNADPRSRSAGRSEAEQNAAREGYLQGINAAWNDALQDPAVIDPINYQQFKKRRKTQ